MKRGTAICILMVFNLVFAGMAVADTKLVNTRTGIHENFTRIVLDSTGDYPLSIEQDSKNVIDICYENLIITEEEENEIQLQLDKVSDPSIYRDEKGAHLRITAKSSEVKIKSSYLPSRGESTKGYRLVVDMYPESSDAGKEERATAGFTVAENNDNKQDSVQENNKVTFNTQIPPGKNISEAAAVVPGSVATVMEPSKPGGSGETSLNYNTLEENSVPGQVNKKNDEMAVITEEKITEEIPEEPAQPEVEITGKVEVIVRNTDGERESSKFDEYSDRAEAVSGNIEINRSRENSSKIQLEMKDIGQENQNALFIGEIYGTVKFMAEYDELPHRYQYGARTLYSGIGTGTLELDDTMQNDLESTLFPDLDNSLSAYFNSSIAGDPVVIRKKGKLNLEWVKFDPLRFNIEFKKEKRSGTIPRFGALGSNNTVELLEPVDHDTMHLKFNGEYKKGAFQLSTTYYLSVFKNDNKILSWDNPLALNDSLFNSSRGLMSLAPDNHYQNISLSGYLGNLPWHTRISGNMALGWMSQDESLAAYTINTAVTAPSVPVENIDAEVETRLLNLLITSNPYNSINLKIKFRSYEHENNTTPINFSGFADIDDYFNPTPVINLPSGYKKDTIDAGFRIDLFDDSRLSFNYKWEKMERSNREVSEQNDDGFKVSIDSTHIPWIYLRTSYERVKRDTENYVFDRYLDSGEDLTQNPLLRKYDESDMTRDRIRLQADITPWEKLGFSLSYIFGQDDFDNSTYGLLEDRHSIFSFDADYTLSDNFALHLFYTNERYRNFTSGNGFTIAEVEDWTVNGDDRVDTVGGGITSRLFSDNLDLDIAYSYSKADGKLDFAVNGVGFSSLDKVDDSRFQMFDAKINYRIGKRWACSLGYLWEKVSFSDFNKEGFTYVPSDGSPLGIYQGTLLMGILPEDYDVTQAYLKVSHFF